MMMKTTVLLLSIASLGFAQDYATCTSIIREPGGCCPPRSAHTATATIDCHGCALETAIGPICEIACLSTKINPGTTTVTTCAPSIQPGGPIQTVTSYPPRSLTTSPLSNPGGPIEPCTSTITTRGGIACTRVSAAHTATTSIDCQGCVLTTTTLPPGGVCTGGIKTVYDAYSTTTVTACESGTS
ncbi:hypothetical protein EV356DRAFT_205633 [Viridothelium virens]|uniref:Uncharacterized protein n=1 Tax=Viridothelium virens TaxID=1048519 RepID=A0A6A6H650_VIRVR|nr:hypothetical protein EV356DRAFT_205633 [Viridothelium virens]